MLIQKIQNRLDEEEYVQKYVNKLEKTVNRIESDMQDMFVRVNQDGGWSRAELAKYNRAQKLRSQIRQQIKKYRNGFVSDYRDDLAAMYRDETLFTQNALSDIPQLGITTEFDRLPTQAIKSEVVDIVTIKGKTMQEYVSKYGVDLAFRVEQEMFESIALGENPRKTARRLRNLQGQMANRVEMTIRSWNNAIYNQSNMMVYEQADIEKVLYLATLDLRTCSICAADHNKIYTRADVPLLPRHPNCRCAYSPWIEGYTEKADGYGAWLRDGRRSRAQVDEVLARTKSFMRRGLISEEEGNYLLGLIGQAISQMA
jgi:SPP1 gp7 family putative phage head morphogenesis protein